MSSSRLCSPGWNKLSEHLIYEILLRLPVESLLRFKTVSKHWRSLISSPGFVESQCTRPGSYNGTTLIIHEDEDHLDGWFSLLQIGPSLLRTGLHFPCFRFESDESASKIVGSDRGIVCITECGNPFHMSYSDPGNTYLWNPATKHYKLIPANISYDDTRIVGLGFGFDPIDKDFKVVRVVNSPSQSEVYSANLNAWRKVGPKPTNNQYEYDFKGCINGLLCWTGLHYILTFDLNKEVFTCVTKLPFESRQGCITNFNESIVVFVGKGSNDKINLWRLNNVECLRRGGIVGASWTLMLSIDTDDVLVHSIHSYFNSGDILLWSGKNWLSYNSVQKKATKVSTSIRWGEIFKYTESLVSITGFEHEDYLQEKRRFRYLSTGD